LSPWRQNTRKTPLAEILSPAPPLAGKLGGDPPRAQAGLGKREGEDALLQVRPELVRHPRPAPLPDPERLQTPAVDSPLPAVVGRVVHAHRPAGGADADLCGEREDAQAEAEEHVIIRHAVLQSRGVVTNEMRLSRTSDATCSRGWRRRLRGLSLPTTCRENSESVQVRQSIRAEDPPRPRGRASAPATWRVGAERVT
jgi:hypothetical protein